MRTASCGIATTTSSGWTSRRSRTCARRSTRSRAPPSVTDSLTITARHNGPPGSANGGYTCGLLAQQVDSEVVEVTLRKPPPPEQPLEPVPDGERVDLRDDGELIA